MTYSMNITNSDIPDINRLIINNHNDIIQNEVQHQDIQLQERNIDYLLQNPQQMLNSVSLTQQHIQGQINNLESNFVNLNINNLNSTTDIELIKLDNEYDDNAENEEYDNNYDNAEDEEERSNPLYNKIVPLEVANYYCKDYFDDEDFIYMRFELPNDLIEEIMESGNKTVTEYFDSFLNNIEITEDDTQELTYFNMYNSCVKVYDVILQHYMPQWYDYDGPIDDDNTYVDFNEDWTHNCRFMLDTINNILTLGMSDDSIKYLCNYNKEVYTGLIIIISRLKQIFLYFNDKSSVSQFMDYNKDYRNITIRIVNNICVILLYLKFYYLNNLKDGKENDLIYSDKMITIEDD